MSVAEKYQNQISGYQTPQELATQNPQLYAQIVSELRSSSNPQDQQLYSSMVNNAGSPASENRGFVVHPEMKQAMTAQQEAYKNVAVESQPQSNITQASEDQVINKQVSALGPEPGTPSYAVQGSYVQQGSKVYDKSGGLVGTVGSPNMPALTPGETYSVEPPKAPVQQSDLGVSTQLDIAMQLGLKTIDASLQSNLKNNDVLKGLAKLEVDYGLAPLGGFAVGGVAALENEAYATASLINSGAKSIQTGKLQYAPVKSPMLMPTVFNAGVNAAFGNQSEMQRINDLPKGYSLGYTFGSNITDVGLMVVGGEAIGFTAGKVGGLVSKVSPKIDTIAESVLARSKVVAQSGLNRVSPGLGVEADLIYGKDVARIAKGLDRADVVLSQRASAARLNFKFGVVEPVKERASLAFEKFSVKTGKVSERLVPENLKEASIYSKAVVTPNLGEYGKVLVPKSFSKIPKSIKQSELYQGSKFNLERFSSNLKQKVPVDIKVPLRQEFKGKYIIGRIQPKVSSIKPLKAMGEFKLSKGVTSTKNIDSFDALKIASKRKRQPMGAAYDNTFKMNEPSSRAIQVVKQVEKQTLKTSSKVGAKTVSSYAIVASSRAYPGTQRQRFTEELEVVSLPRSMADLKNPESSYVRLTAMPVLDSMPKFSRGVTVASLTPSLSSRLGGGFTPFTSQKQPQSPEVSLRLGGGQVPIQNQPASLKFDIPTPTLNIPKQQMKFPMFERAGGGGAGLSFDSLRGRWSKQNNPIKSYDRMLKDIGGIKVSKQMKTSLNRLDKNMQKLDKLGNKKGNRGKRKR